MRRYVKFCVCAAAAALMFASACGQKQGATEETTAAADTDQEITGQVELGQYKGVEIQREDRTVTDEEVQSAIDSRLEANPDWVEVERPAENGDTVNIDFVGIRGGEAFEGGTGENYDLVLGSGSFIDGFEEGLVGAVKGQELSLDLTFPDPYLNNPDLAGQPVVFDVTVNRVEEPQTPELNDAFVQRISDFDTVDAWEADLRAQLEDAKEQQAETAEENALFDAVVANATFTDVDASIEAEYERMMEQNETLLAMQGMDLDQYLSYFNMDQAAYEERMHNQADYNVKLELVLAKIAETEGLEIDDEARQAVADINGVENFDALKEVAGETDAERFARNWTAMEFLKDNAVYK